MEKVKIEIAASHRQFEVANYLLKQALKSLTGKDKKKIREQFGVSLNDLRKVEAFRMLIVESFIKNAKVPDLESPIHIYRETHKIH